MVIYSLHPPASVVQNNPWSPVSHPKSAFQFIHMETLAFGCDARTIMKMTIKIIMMKAGEVHDSLLTLLWVEV